MKKSIIAAGAVICGALVLGSALFISQSIMGGGGSLPRPKLPEKGSDNPTAYTFSSSFELPNVQEASVYKVTTGSAAQIYDQVEDVLGIEDITTYDSFGGETGESFYSLEDKGLMVCVNTQNGFWDITMIDEPITPPEDLPSDQEAEEIARDFISKHGLFSGDLGEAVITHGYTGSEETGDRVNLDVSVTFIPDIDGHEVYGLYRINVTVGDNGEIKSVFNQAAPTSNSGKVRLKTREQVMQEVADHPESLSNTSSSTAPGTITGCELKYYFDGTTENGESYAHPIYVLTAQSNEEGISTFSTAGDEDEFTVLIDAAA